MLESEVDRYKVIDTDTHVIEPYDLWTSRLDVKKWGDKVPHVKFDEQFQEDAWYFGDKRVGAAAAAAQAGWSQYPPQHPPRLDDVDPATWEASARLNVMDKYGIWAAVLYPNVAGFGAGKMLTIGDGELMLACVQAYNDFLAEYSSIAPDRFVPIMALPFWDLEATEKEIARCRRPRPQGRDHDRRAVLLGHAQARRPALGPAVGGVPGRRAVGELPHRLGRHVDLRRGPTRAPASTPTTPASACSSASPTCR